MNRVRTNEPPGSDALAKEFTAIDPNTNTLENKLTDIQIEASHSKYNNQHQAALLILEGLKNRGSRGLWELQKNCQSNTGSNGPISIQQSQMANKVPTSPIIKAKPRRYSIRIYPLSTRNTKTTTNLQNRTTRDTQRLDTRRHKNRRSNNSTGSQTTMP